MEKREYNISFTTPAFLGDANQQGKWRTPPFKALIRQWWRIVVAKEYHYHTDDIRKAEAELFGCAADENGGGKSKLRLRLGAWKKGSLAQWNKKGFSRLDRQVSSDVYLGYGPVSPASKKDNKPSIHLSHPPAIEANEETNTLKIGFDPACSDKQIQEVDQAIQLIAWFGTLGGRSRNGWGSLHLLKKDNSDFGIPNVKEIACFSSSLKDCLLYEYIDSEWACAFATDEKGLLIWQQDVSSWQKAVDILAALRKESRKSVEDFKTRGLQATHLLGYPVMKPTASVWEDGARFPNQLRFKVAQLEHSLRIYVIHLPCTVPNSVWKNGEDDMRDWVNDNQLRIWQTVHQYLDNSQLTRLGSTS
ncbi:MAG: hypothetical protein Q9M28_05400 [Mariprofundaceae bacterium]|nr:hypothetical protein [Mariprofundaceae bacterium]